MALNDSTNPFPGLDIAVIIPCYQVAGELPSVLSKIPAWVKLIICVDDCCPQNSGEAAQATLGNDPRLHILRHDMNQGVGGAMITGYKEAMRLGAEIMVKLDGDGQMDPARIENLVQPVAGGYADYAKGNRFFRIESLQGMPPVRLAGNAGLSFFAKLSSGYWDIFDPNNGFTALHASVCRMLPLDRIHHRYFFESDMLFRLNTLRAVVIDVPMDARYGEETSSLSPAMALGQFPLCHARNFCKRIFYGYFLRDFNLASLYLMTGLPMLILGGIYGACAWMQSYYSGVPAHTGTIMLAVLPVLLGVQFLLSFFQHDMSNRPTVTLWQRLREMPSALENRAGSVAPQKDSANGR